MAQFEIERTLAATGNLFIEVETAASQQRVRMVPIEHIAGGSANLHDAGVLDYILLEYDTYTRPSEGNPNASEARQGSSATVRRVQEWVPTFEQEGPLLPSIDNIEVSTSKRIKHVAVNRMSNWWWGVPDLYAVTFWARAYKKYLEQCHTLNEAYARIAHKVSTASAAGADRAASQMAANPGIDPGTGQPLNVGATAIMELAKISWLADGTPGRFRNGLPLAAMVAAGLEIPPGDDLRRLHRRLRASDNTLDEATKKTMRRGSR